MGIEKLIGKKMKSIVVCGRDSIIFECETGETYKMFHDRNCCEDVYIDDICGDLQDLIGYTIISAEEVHNKEFEDEWKKTFNKTDFFGERINSKGDEYPDSHTWTFYKISTIDTDITKRGCGESNGYYSEDVDFEEI